MKNNMIFRKWGKYKTYFTLSFIFLNYFVMWTHHFIRLFYPSYFPTSMESSSPWSTSLYISTTQQVFFVFFFFNYYSICHLIMLEFFHRRYNNIFLEVMKRTLLNQVHLTETVIRRFLKIITQFISLKYKLTTCIYELPDIS